ncbi:helix-turn-helix domain-containing protein [Nocardioides hwasunensis]|uniref:Helix-turn-helix domain-containing protein n=2 Tax=Nocardioides hwasunensis TaxID=397258 RepID=A0ABR8MIL2_9ACTN|nr:helix-turn-helix domain-containing protein [Nocardioides hwasunensis]
MLSPDEAAEYLLTTRGVLSNWRYKGVGPRFVRLNSKIVYRLSDLEEYVSERIVETVDSVGR